MSDLTLFTDTDPAAPVPPAPAPADTTASVVHGAVIISAVETAWREIRCRFDGVPDISVTVPPTVTAQDPTKCTALRTGRRFERDGHLTMELQVSSATLGLGGRPMMEGLLHHAAHGLALTRGITEVSGGDRRWHNKKYGRLAQEVGLTPPARSDRFVGRAYCPLTDNEAARWAEIITALDAAAAVQLEATVRAVEAPRGGRSGARFAIVCDCIPPRRQQVTPYFFEQGPLLCGLCLAKFRPADAVLPHQATGSDS
ncbi:hypothetical protein AQI95_43055 [Streptomyces yokosukanensis]|uniref:SprT-like domain-containing protein n=1 Tax=Streptomyces yokosukanensis TaxID=67386 RepID=A0A101NMK6_9ACTN|nr:hypothetical protein [Streptomyces yokosukanensis]KUM95744.1 hypothetical protein AQI95_43055 [Streptomyces yokosukanensis]